MRKVICVSALLLVLACPAHAGDMPNGSPESPKATAVQEPTGGEMHTGETPDSTADVLTQTVLEVLAVLPSLL